MKLDDYFGVHAQSLQLSARRAEVLANNMANADTPGFKARDIDFEAALRAQVGATGDVVTTNANHFSSDQDMISPAELAYRISTQPSLDGNTVDTEAEHTAFAGNALRYQASLRFLDGQIQSLLTAIKG